MMAEIWCHFLKRRYFGKDFYSSNDKFLSSVCPSQHGHNCIVPLLLVIIKNNNHETIQIPGLVLLRSPLTASVCSGFLLSFPYTSDGQTTSNLFGSQGESCQLQNILPTTTHSTRGSCLEVERRSRAQEHKFTDPSHLRWIKMWWINSRLFFLKCHNPFKFVAPVLLILNLWTTAMFYNKNNNNNNNNKTTVITHCPLSRKSKFCLLKQINLCI